MLPLRDLLPTPAPLIRLIDVGSMPEGENRYDILLHEYLVETVYGFEPNPEQFARLSQNPSVTFRYFPYFIGRGGPATMHWTRYPGCSSLYPPNPEIIDLFHHMGDNFEVESTEEVVTHKLDDIPECGGADFIKIDVQGGELDVLKGAEKLLDDLLVIEAEVEFIPLYKGQPLFGEVQNHLQKKGFLFHKLIDLGGSSFSPFSQSARPVRPLSQIMWGDGVFVRDFTQPDRLSSEQLLKTALLLHYLYFSPDLAHLFLRHYDQRKGTTICAGYEKMLSENEWPKRPFFNLRGT